MFTPRGYKALPQEDASQEEEELLNDHKNSILKRSYDKRKTWRDLRHTTDMSSPQTSRENEEGASNNQSRPKDSLKVEPTKEKRVKRSVRFASRSLEDKQETISNSRRFCFVISLMICTLTIFVFAFTVPCEGSTCNVANMIENVKRNLGYLHKNWTVSLDGYSTGIGFLLPVNKTRAIVVSFNDEKRMKVNRNARESGLLCMHEYNGQKLWLYNASDVLRLIECRNDGGFETCLILSSFGRLQLINPSKNEIIWSTRILIGSLLPSVFLVINDCDGDKGRDILLSYDRFNATCQRENIEMSCKHPGILQLISGGTGYPIGSSLNIPQNHLIKRVSFHSSKTSEHLIFVLMVGDKGHVKVISIQDLYRKILDGKHSETPHLFDEALSVGVSDVVSAKHEPVVTDLNEDSVQDIVLVTVAGNRHSLTAVDGGKLNKMWKIDFRSRKMLNQPVIGHFNDDKVPDILVILQDSMLSTFNQSLVQVLDGQNGDILWSSKLRLVKNTTPLSASVGYKSDVFYLWIEKQNNRRYRKIFPTRTSKSRKVATTSFDDVFKKQNVSEHARHRRSPRAIKSRSKTSSPPRMVVKEFDSFIDKAFANDLRNLSSKKSLQKDGVIPNEKSESLLEIKKNTHNVLEDILKNEREATFSVSSLQKLEPTNVPGSASNLQTLSNDASLQSTVKYPGTQKLHGPLINILNSRTSVHNESMKDILASPTNFLNDKESSESYKDISATSATRMNQDWRPIVNGTTDTGSISSQMRLLTQRIDKKLIKSSNSTTILTNDTHKQSMRDIVQRQPSRTRGEQNKQNSSSESKTAKVSHRQKSPYHFIIFNISKMSEFRKREKELNISIAGKEKTAVLEKTEREVSPSLRMNVSGAESSKKARDFFPRHLIKSGGWTNETKINDDRNSSHSFNENTSLQSPEFKGNFSTNHVKKGSSPEFQGNYSMNHVKKDSFGSNQSVLLNISYVDQANVSSVHEDSEEMKEILEVNVQDKNNSEVEKVPAKKALNGTIGKTRDSIGHFVHTDNTTKTTISSVVLKALSSNTSKNKKTSLSSSSLLGRVLSRGISVLKPATFEENVTDVRFNVNIKKETLGKRKDFNKKNEWTRFDKNDTSLSTERVEQNQESQNNELQEQEKNNEGQRKEEMAKINPLEIQQRQHVQQKQQEQQGIKQLQDVEQVQREKQHVKQQQQNSMQQQQHQKHAMKQQEQQAMIQQQNVNHQQQEQQGVRQLQNVKQQRREQEQKEVKKQQNENHEEEEEVENKVVQKKQREHNEKQVTQQQQQHLQEQQKHERHQQEASKKQEQQEHERHQQEASKKQEQQYSHQLHHNDRKKLESNNKHTKKQFATRLKLTTKTFPASVFKITEKQMKMNTAEQKHDSLSSETFQLALIAIFPNSPMNSFSIVSEEKGIKGKTGGDILWPKLVSNALVRDVDSEGFAEIIYVVNYGDKAQSTMEMKVKKFSFKIDKNK